MPPIGYLFDIAIIKFALSYFLSMCQIAMAASLYCAYR